MGGRELSTISFGNGQNRNKDFSQRSRGVGGRSTCEQMVKARNRLVFLSFSVVDSLQHALAFVTAAGIQAKYHTRHIPVCSDPGRRSTGPRIDMPTCISKLPEDRHHVVRPVVAKLESLGVGFAFGVAQWIWFVVIKFGRGGRGLEPN